MTRMTRTADEGAGVRDARLPERLLLAEQEAFVRLLRSRATDEHFAVRTCCPGWTVRHVVAHCSAALDRVLTGRFEEGAFSPETNERDIAERADWPLARLIDELDWGFGEAGAVMAGREDGTWDAIAFGEWVHAGDVRDAWRVGGAYGGRSVGPALELLAHLTRVRKSAALRAELGDRGTVRLGADEGTGDADAVYVGDAATLMRLYGNRPLAGTRYELSGVTEAELVFFT
ncbi:maleylpyruvate isomerase family mycothiol-dependent enzyme [Streptomyces sp. NPDC021093]|uniref:maleylpyruvate isomerase family mycothiol-dependent enzyme n=1 Tax=Streptomyces sp. NPDC021093 TaxID=3365112 RepID=UPI0037A5E5BC